MSVTTNKDQLSKNNNLIHIQAKFQIFDFKSLRQLEIENQRFLEIQGELIKVYYRQIQKTNVKVIDCKLCSIGTIEKGSCTIWYVMYMNMSMYMVKKLMSQISGKTEHNFCIRVNNQIDIFGMTTDNRLSFDNTYQSSVRK